MRTDKQTLESGLKKLKDVAAKNRILPIYSGILVQDGYMIASNSAYSVKLPIDSGLDHDAGFILMPDAINLISNLPAGDVEITKEGAGTIRVKGGKVKANFQSHDVSEFALMPKISDSIAFTVKWKEVKEKMASVLFACVRDDSKPLLRGLHLFTRDGVLNMLACDGYPSGVSESLLSRSSRTYFDCVSNHGKGCANCTFCTIRTWVSHKRPCPDWEGKPAAVVPVRVRGRVVRVDEAGAGIRAIVNVAAPPDRPNSVGRNEVRRTEKTAKECASNPE